MKAILIESKVFEISLAGSQSVCILERVRKVIKELVFSFLTALRVAKSLEECFHSAISLEFI